MALPPAWLQGLFAVHPTPMKADASLDLDSLDRVVDHYLDGGAAGLVPASVKQWVLMRVGAYYDNRDAWTSGKPIERNAFVDRLLDRWKVPSL